MRGMRASSIPSWRLAVVLVLALAVLLSGCEDVIVPVPLPGRVAGSVTLGGAPLSLPPEPIPSPVPLRAAPVAVADAPFVPGELLVGLRPRDGLALAAADAFAASLSASLAASSPASRFAPAVVAHRVEALGAVLIRFGDVDAAATLAAAAIAAAHPDVAYVHPNYLLSAARIPNDPLYARQWHYERINLPAAWDVTIGSSSTIVAVVDGGVPFHPTDPTRRHPDLFGKLVAGYDFITDPESAGDGDGRDADPFDPSPAQHGGHVAGTIAAATNDGFGIAGVDWRARLLPVRALGVTGSGTLLDIAEATLWSAGFPVAGVPANANPAHVINLSLGGALPCPLLFQDAFDLIEASAPNAAVVVAAAGNVAVDAATFAPGNCRGVITVGATEARDFRASYSNYGTRIDVMAPGGDLAVDRTGDGFPDGVFSLTAAPGHGYLQGTSMAAPHVAGVIALLKSLDPTLTRAEALALLTATARPLSAAACNRPSGFECGAGLIDAAAALTLLQGGVVPEPGVGDLRFDPVALDFGAFADRLDVLLRNVGGVPLTWQARMFTPEPGNPGAMPDYTIGIGASGGTIPAGASELLTVSVDRARVSAAGLYRFAITFEVGGQQVPLPGSFVKQPPVARPNGPMFVAAIGYDAFGQPFLAGEIASIGVIRNFNFPVESGLVHVVAWSDEDLDGDVSAGDYFGVHPSLVTVLPQVTTSGIDVPIERVVGQVDDPLARDLRAVWGRTVDAE
jgi:serine protease